MYQATMYQSAKSSKRASGVVGSLVAGLLAVMSLGACAEPLATEQSMTQQRLHELLEQHAEGVQISSNMVQFNYQNVSMLVVSDRNADRMRIISPIASIADVEPQMLLEAMAANFHSVLDARYAIGDGSMIYAAFIHPLSPLTEAQLMSALGQVASAHATFGTSYSSGALVFPGGGAGEEVAAESEI